LFTAVDIFFLFLSFCLTSFDTQKPINDQSVEPVFTTFDHKKKLTQRFFPFVFCCEFTIESPAYLDVSFFIFKKQKTKPKIFMAVCPLSLSQ
jgi:hypothetical protein